MTNTIHKTFKRVAHRRKSEQDQYESSYYTGRTWEIAHDPYICSGGLCQHFDIPLTANELEVLLIVADRRPDPEAQRVYKISPSPDCEISIEGVNSRHTTCRVVHGTHQRFQRHLRSAFKVANAADSKVWMLCKWDTIEDRVKLSDNTYLGFS